MANSAVIVKMTRVIMIAPMLIVLGLYLSYQAKKSGSVAGAVQLVIPWFAVYFIGMAGVNSIIEMYLTGGGAAIAETVHGIISAVNEVDTFLLTMAMTALGMGTRFAKFKGLGIAPLYTGAAMFAWLVIGGFLVTKAVTTFL